MDVTPRRPEEEVVGLVELQCCQVEVDLNEQVSKMWRLDAIGILTPANEVHLPMKEEVEAEELLSKGLKYCNGRYEAPMLWLDARPQTNNF